LLKDKRKADIRFSSNLLPPLLPRPSGELSQPINPIGFIDEFIDFIILHKKCLGQRKLYRHFSLKIFEYFVTFSP